MEILKNILASSIVVIIFVFIIIFIYFLMNRRAMKLQQKHFLQLHENLKIGVKIRTSGGIHGVVKRVGKDTVDIEVKSGAILEVSRYSISEIEK